MKTTMYCKHCEKENEIEAILMALKFYSPSDDMAYYVDLDKTNIVCVKCREPVKLSTEESDELYDAAWKAKS
jgi:hypothetical protein